MMVFSDGLEVFEVMVDEFRFLPFDVVNTSLQLCKETDCHVLLFLSEVSLQFHEFFIDFGVLFLKL